MRCRLEVPVSGADVGVTHIGGKRQHVLANLVASFGAGLESSNGKRVPNVMDARSAPTGLQSRGQSFSIVVETSDGQPDVTGGGRARNENVVCAGCFPFPTNEVAFKPRRRTFVQGNKARLLELRLADNQPIRCNIAHAQVQRLRYSETCGSKQGE